MGIVSSRLEEPGALYLWDQNRLSIASLVITSPRRRTAVNIVPNAFPATRLSASRLDHDGAPLEFIQDPESSNSAAGPAFILKLDSDDELVFTFTFVIRQTQQVVQASTGGVGAVSTQDTQINGLTYACASTPRELENLVTREFHANPNLHKTSNVNLVGTYTTGGSPSVAFEWSWKWKPPRNTEDKGGGWRNSCSFVEYDQRAHRLHTLASFSFWVSNTSPYLSQPNSPSPLLLNPPPKARVASAQSIESGISTEYDEPQTPLASAYDVSSTTLAATPATTKEPIRVDVSCPRPGEDMAVAGDGPVFRATIKALEQKTGNMRTQTKRLIKKAEQAHACHLEANDTLSAFFDALKEAAATNANAVQPAIEHYFDKIAREIMAYERQSATSFQKIIVEPLNKLYTMDIKQAEAKKRDFEEESKDYYNYVSRYLGQRHESVKTKKLADSDSKYQTKRRNFELKRFDYSSFMQDLSGGRKEQEVLSHLTKYADAQAKCFLDTAQKVEALLPELEALSSQVQDADKEYQYQRREREEKRRLLEKSNLPYIEPEPSSIPQVAVQVAAPPQSSNGNLSNSDTELGRADSTGSQLKGPAPAAGSTSSAAGDLSKSPGTVTVGSLTHHASVGSPPQNSKFRGIRDLEERDPSQAANAEKNGTQRKEGLLWALNRPGGHVDPRNLNKQGWHKFWIVLDQGKLSEYSNWKQKLDLHMEPIDLRMASVREARNAERRFCFEVITPQFKRVYQATSEEDMNTWITAINNALQSAVEGRAFRDKPVSSPSDSTFSKRDIGSVLTGKSPSLNHGTYHPATSATIPTRRITVGGRPGTSRSASFEENPVKLLQMLRDNDQGNLWCADCASNSKVEWVSINLGIILCIECSGIHRSLGTHISKVRSLTLDITSFTPDIVELLLLIGNRVSNMVWEAKLDPALKPAPQATREQRLKFITAKYVDRAFVEPLSATLSRYPTADETLLASIKKNEIQEVIYALALRANPNTTDKSRGTHAIFLALAASDPAPPSPTPTPLRSPDAAAEKVVTFPVAELLLQNGSEIPLALPAFPLSRHAQAYIDMKRGRSAAFNTGPDGVGSLPTPTPLAAEKLQREKESRLQKRISAGGRLAKSPIPER